MFLSKTFLPIVILTIGLTLVCDTGGVAQQLELVVQTEHVDSVNSVVFSTDGKLLASGSDDNTIKIWDISTGKLLRTLIGHSNDIDTIAFSHDSKMIASGSDTTIKLWSVLTGEQLKTFAEQEHSVSGVAFSFDSKTLFSSGYDKTIRFWDVESGTNTRTLIGHSDGINSLALSHSGKTLASVARSYDISSRNSSVIKLWSAVDGTQIQTLVVAPVVSSIVFSPDEKFLAIAFWDGLIKFWEIESNTFLKTIKQVRQRNKV